jgi:putative Holliday junction resolvase
MTIGREALTVMGFDYGTKRIGVAVGQTITRTASPLATIAARNGDPRWDEIAKLVSEWSPDLFVVGLPSFSDDKAHPLHDDIQRFSRRLSGRYHHDVEFVDEYLSSIEASNDHQTTKHGLDAAAARLILITWFEQRPRRRPLNNEN